MGFFNRDKKNTKTPPGTERYMTFKVMGQIYGIPAAIVSEVSALGEISELPDESGEIAGVMELKGHALIVLDLGMRLLGRHIERTERTCALVVGYDGKPESACLIDAALDIINVPFERMDVKTAEGFQLYKNNGENILLPDTQMFFVN